MKNIKGKHILRQLLTAALIIMGLAYFLIAAKNGFNENGFSIKDTGNFDRKSFFEKYNLGYSQRLHISIEHYKERNGFTPVVLSTGSLTVIKFMDQNGSVFGDMAADDGHKELLFTVDADEGYILVDGEVIPCEITLRGKMRTRLRLDGEDANATVAVSPDKKEGELFLFGGRIKTARLYFIKEETADNQSKVKIFGPETHSMEKFIFDEETKILYSVEEYNRMKEMKERAQNRLSTTSINSVKSIPITERQALISLYNSTNGDNWKTKSGWKTPPLEADGFAAYGTEGNWYGITVESGHVIRIYLAWKNLTGTIPPELGNLYNLENLNLYINSLSGPIPPEVGNLSNLKYLCLNSNNLSGSIPKELGKLYNLELGACPRIETRR